MVEYASEPLQGVDVFGYRIDDPEPWMNPPSGWSEWAEEGRLRRLVINGTPPPPAKVSEMITKPDITGVMINRLDPGFRDLHWLEPDALRASTMREFEVTAMEGKPDISPLRVCRSLEVVSVAPQPSRKVDFQEWESEVKSLGITQGARSPYRNIRALQHLEFLAVDLPGENIEYIAELTHLKELRLTAARKVSSLPLRSGQPLESLMIYRTASLDLATLESVSQTLVEIELDGVKAIQGGEVLRSCHRLRSVTLENCGPSLSVDDLLNLLESHALTRVLIIGTALPFTRKECDRLNSSAPPKARISVLPL